MEAMGLGQGNSYILGMCFGNRDPVRMALTLCISI